MNTDKVGRQRFALIIGEGVVRAVGEITGVTVHGDRVAPLSAGHPIQDRYLGTPGSRRQRLPEPCRLLRPRP
jgi:hypothetical protein